MKTDQGTVMVRHPDAYSGVLSTGRLHDLVEFSVAVCRHHGASGTRRCAHAALRDVLCPCAWNVACITDAVESELIRGRDTDRHDRARRSDPISRLSVPHAAP